MEWSLHNIIWDSQNGLEVENIQPGLGMEILVGISDLETTGLH